MGPVALAAFVFMTCSVERASMFAAELVCVASLRAWGGYDFTFDCTVSCDWWPPPWSTALR